MGFFGTWILPPLAGAVIGYFTNWLAIKMLFRPLREHRLLGMRVPFTPGVLPRERGRIAKNIGDTVARELLTETVLRRRLSEPDVRTALVAGIDARLRELLATKASKALPSTAAMSGPLGRLVSRAWESVVSSAPFRSALEEAARLALLETGQLPLERLVPAGKAGELAELVLAPRNVETWRARLGAGIDAMYAREVAEAGPERAREPEGGAGEPFLIPAEVLEPVVAAAVEGVYRACLPAVASFLNEPELKAIIGRYANDIVRSAIGRLNLFQRLIVGAAQYERRIIEGMPQTVDEMIAAAVEILKGPGMVERAAGAASAAFRKAAAEPLGATLRRLVSERSLREAANALLDAAAASGPAFVERLASRAVSKPGASLASLLGAAGLSIDEVAGRTALAVSRALSGTEGGQEASRVLALSLSGFLDALEKGLGESMLGETIGLDGGAKAELAAYLADKALELIAQETGRIVAGLDIGRIVVERINELDMREVERLVLDVAGKELNWITLLGGVLGGMIGVVQSLLTIAVR